MVTILDVIINHDVKIKYMLPVYNFSQIPHHRKIIRSSLKLNNLLLKNKNLIESIFLEAKGNCNLNFCKKLICENFNELLTTPRIVQTPPDEKE